MKLSGFDLIRLFSSLQLLILFSGLISHRPLSSRRFLLSVFAIAQGCFILTGIFYGLDPYVAIRLDSFSYAIFAFSFSIGPAIYLFTRLSHTQLQLERKDLYHLVTIAIALVANVMIFKVPSTDYFLFTPSSDLRVTSVAGLVFFYLITGIYLCASILFIKRQNAKLAGIPSGLLLFIYGSIILWICEFALSFAFLTNALLFCKLKIVVVVAQFFLINVIVFLSLKRSPEWLEKAMKTKYAKDQLTEEQKNIYVSRILAYMQNEKPFIQPDFTLQQLAQHTGIPSRHVSQVLNSSLQQSFIDFVNRYRVEESKRLLQEPNSQQMTILAILYDVGFTSKSTFNHAFKKHTGTTPSQFRNSIAE
ncbi:MAG: helix-turn-helix transcriptional regulator [Bacteroidetes bacterium]|nr:helix-turn-helix transcriptional regulator [Bacteroidota bacterium]